MKILNLPVLIVGLVLFFNPVFANNVDFDSEIKNAKIQMKKYLTSLGTCSPGSFEKGMTVIKGQRNNYCYIKQYIYVFDEKVPYRNCKMSMNEIRAYAREHIAMLDSGRFVYNSDTDKFERSCKFINTKPKVDNELDEGTFSSY